MTESDKKHHILVTAAGGPAGINALRLLRKYPELRIFATDINPESIGKQYADEFALMAPFADRENYERDLRRLVTEWGIDVVLPTLADELHVIEDTLAGIAVDILVSPKETALLCSDKRLLYAWMTEHLPDYCARWQTLDHSISWDAPEYFIKPAIGRGSRGCEVISKEALPKFVGSLEHPEEWVVMDVLPGKEWSVDAYVARSGEPIFIVPRERLEVESGIARKGRTLKHTQIISQTRAIFDTLTFIGPVNVQWKEDGKGGVKLIEINARLSGGLMITVSAGADPMKVFVDELLGRSLLKPDWKEGEFIGFTDFTRA